ncbi:hypothetical protein B0H13DRAFT_2014624 [Mycena leptocephala]|nr:hypothetical protein B0H13DRAFT_2153895 [Mycena leptocephala]KAJ7909236.1 hypothetical protein B0H13DRAFT_2014624 [Mycena leptocephala]
MGTQVSPNGRCLLSRISSNSRLNFFFQGLVPCSTLGMAFFFFSYALLTRGFHALAFKMHIFLRLPVFLNAYISLGADN